MMVKPFATAFAVIVLTSFIDPAAADYRCNNRFGCTRTAVLWSYGVPGIAVGYYKQQCENQRNPSARFYLGVQPGQIPGSNVVTCYYEQSIRRGG